MPKGDSSSSRDKEQLEGLCSVVVHPHHIIEGSVMTMQGEASFEPFHTASNEGGEEALPQGCQEQLRMALDRKLDEELAEGPAVTHNTPENSDGVAAVPRSSASGGTVSLFKRARRVAFSPESINRRVSTAAREDNQNRSETPKKRRRLQEHLSPSQLQERVRAAAVEGELIRAAARQLAARAAASIQPVQEDSSGDEHQDSEPQATVTRVLRGLVANAILTGNMQASQHQRWKLSASATGSGSISKVAQKKLAADLKQDGNAGAETAALSEQRPHNSATNFGEKQPAYSCSAMGSGKEVTPGCTESAKLPEEERKARKRAKKQRQKQAARMDPLRRAQEKDKRTKRRCAKKAKGIGVVSGG